MQFAIDRICKMCNACPDCAVVECCMCSYIQIRKLYLSIQNTENVNNVSLANKSSVYCITVYHYMSIFAHYPNQSLHFRVSPLATKLCTFLPVQWVPTQQQAAVSKVNIASVPLLSIKIIWMRGCSLHNGHGRMGRRFTDGGLLRYRKWIPQQLGDVIKQGSGDSRPMGARHSDTAANDNSTHFLVLSTGLLLIFLVNRIGSYF